jgi:hypothetical protein
LFEVPSRANTAITIGGSDPGIRQCGIFQGPILCCKLCVIIALSRHVRSSSPGAWQTHTSGGSLKNLWVCGSNLKEPKTLGKWRRHPDAHKLAWWWVRENPDWRKMPLVDSDEATLIMQYRAPSMLSQALSNGTIVGLPQRHGCGKEARFPADLLRVIAAHRQNGKYPTPPQLMKIYEDLHERVRMLNMLGITGTSVNHRTGYHAPAA